MVSTISVFQCNLMFTNPSRLFQDFQNLEWFVKRWMICNYDVECILTALNDLYYVEWFVLTWIICTCNIEYLLTKSKNLNCCWMIWTVQWNFVLENIPQIIASDVFLPEYPNNEHCPIRKTSLWKFLW